MKLGYSPEKLIRCRICNNWHENVSCPEAIEFKIDGYYQLDSNKFNPILNGEYERKMKHYNYSSEMSPEEHKQEYEKLSEKEQNEAIMNPGHVDEGLWEKAKKISRETYKTERWPFIMYMYEKLGGK